MTAIKQNSKLRKILTVANILNQKVIRLKWIGAFYEAFGRPQDRGLWFVWGNSGSGKSSFVMMLAKAFALLGFKVFYNLCEEEADDSDYIDRAALFNMNEVKDNFYVQNYSYQELFVYLKKRNPPKVLIIDSIVDMTTKWSEFIALKDLCHQKNMILVIVGQAEGKNPRTEIEKSIRYKAKMKIFADGFLATCQGRTIGPNGGRFVIWQEGYNKLNGETQQ